MSTPTKEPTLQERAVMRDSFESFVYNASLAGVFIAPLLIALPPRKFDAYTFMLGGAFVLSANQQLKERTGSGLLSKMARSDMSLPSKAQDIQAQLQAQKDRSRLLELPGSAEVGKKSGSKLEEKAKEIWMGGEKEGWKERRLQEEQEKIAQGEGYGSMIMDQIYEVWNWGEKKGEKLAEKDKAVLKEEQFEREFPKIGKN